MEWIVNPDGTVTHAPIEEQDDASCSILVCHLECYGGGILPNG